MQAAGADIMAQLGLTLIQKPAEQTVAVMQREHEGQSNNINVKVEERIKKWAQICSDAQADSIIM